MPLCSKITWQDECLFRASHGSELWVPRVDEFAVGQIHVLADHSPIVQALRRFSCCPTQSVPQVRVAKNKVHGIRKVTRRVRNEDISPVLHLDTLARHRSTDDCLAHRHSVKNLETSSTANS